MNIIELVKKIITEYPEMEQFTNKIHVDFTDNENETDFGLYSTGDEKTNEDILGNQERRHNFILYAVNQAFTDYDRLANSSFLLDLSYYLEMLEGDYDIEVTINNHKRTGKLKSIKCANAMLFNIPTGNINDGITYQVQIYADYTLKSEE